MMRRAPPVCDSCSRDYCSVLTRRLLCRRQGRYVPGSFAFLHSIVSVVSFSVQIELKAEDLYDKEKVDLETIVIDDVFKLLQCSDTGLEDTEAQRRLGLFGPNKLESEEQNAFLQVSDVLIRHMALPC
jgi:hypothetical protein